MKVLMTGSAGMLASDIIPVLQKEGHQVVMADIDQRLEEIQKMDITDLKEVFTIIERENPDYIFHLAAETDVDLCQKKPDHAFNVNTLGTENMALACQKFDIPLLYISTAGVFHGDKPTPYTEFDTPNPVNVYGESKLQGEFIVQNLLSKYFIIRAGWMVGGWELDKKFVYKIVQQLNEGKKELRVVKDKFGTPTFTRDFANNILNVLKTERYGLYHMTNQGTCSRYDMALKITEFMGLTGKVNVVPINSAQFPLPAPRADSEMMRNYKLDLLGLNNMPHWEDSLYNYIRENAVKIK